ncbi:hypothetical protein [Yoonia sp. I 8.24]|uniref:hypothetical protein n=1 Tax=Yoonia sp. I 8.24 TaxID=1537229 RepID=UPI001EDFB035|nr:hypothetical protein [Yoonia sp. I 8.24]MCG3269572.1 hypothetical protein [Yoonia sp. I 8.24]
MTRIQAVPSLEWNDRPLRVVSPAKRCYRPEPLFSKRAKQALRIRSTSKVGLLFAHIKRRQSRFESSSPQFCRITYEGPLSLPRGGTFEWGSPDVYFVHDGLVKCPIRKIHTFDDDTYLQHNAFRAPGAASLGELQALPKKVDYYAAMYGKMHKGIHPNAVRITKDNVDLLRPMDFVFLCMDASPDKQAFVDALTEFGRTFIDIGLACRSHYVIRNGKVRWAGAWSDEQVVRGRQNDKSSKRRYYSEDQKPKLKDVVVAAQTSQTDVSKKGLMTKILAGWDSKTNRRSFSSVAEQTRHRAGFKRHISASLSRTSTMQFTLLDNVRIEAMLFRSSPNSNR